MSTLTDQIKEKCAIVAENQKKFFAVATGLIDGTLTEIRIPEGVTQLPDYRFYKFTNLTSAILPSTLTAIGDRVFLETGITDIEFKNVASIGSHSFYDTALRCITIPSTLTSIGTYVFSHCAQLESAIIEEGCTALGKYMFEYCTALNNVELPSTITVIPDYAFRGCTSLSEISLPEQLTSIANSGFHTCVALREVTLPATCSILGGTTFSDSKNLERFIALGDVHFSGGNNFYNCSKLTDMSLKGMTFGSTANVFAGCTGLINLEVESIKISNRYFSVADSPNLTVQSLLNILNAFEDNTGGTRYTATLGSTNLAKLTEEQIAIATNKNIKLK